MVESAHEHGVGDFEIFAYLDDDDPTWDKYSGKINGVCKVDWHVDPPLSVGKAWNKLAADCRGDYLFMANDDLVFHTPEWDRLLQEAPLPSDGIFVAWANDAWANDGRSQSRTKCCFPYVSRAWYECLGYLAPECFHFLWHDTWVWDVGRRLDRLFHIDHVLIEHRHFTCHKAKYDATYRRHREGSAAVSKRHQDQRMFERTADQRQHDVNKLRQLMITEGK